MTKLKTFRLDEKLVRALKRIAKESKTSETAIVAKALECYLSDYVDYLEAKRRFEDPSDEVISSDEMWRRLGLDEEV